ncbi:MAG: hypothetical protein JWO38_3563 [Gemmataceae bacterium]|nr:hypothetical protein [Gemmataceae bacterium]
MTSDAKELDLLLRECILDLRELDLAGFRRWLGLQLVRWEHDPVFLQRVLIRNLRRSHPQLRVLEEGYRRAYTADAAGPHFARLRDLDTQLVNAGKAVEGLTAAIQNAPPPRQEALQTKLESFRAACQAMEGERAALERSSPERQVVLRAREELDRFRTAIGLDRADARLAEIQTRHGKRSDLNGGVFEDVAEELVRRHVVPKLPATAVRLLRRVRLGAAQAEFDLLLVRTPDRPDELVEVLAAVEAKRNVNDVAHGFLRRQEDLTWLTGDRDRYDPATFRTRTFPTGHFDRPSEHREGENVFRVGPHSFHLFRRDPVTSWFLDRLYLVTRSGWAWGVSAAAIARIATRVSTDEECDAESDTYLTNLLDWAKTLAGPIETPDVLRWYAASPERAQQILFASR